MRLGCCINMLADDNDSVGMKYIPLLKKAGYDYVEIPLAQTMELENQRFTEMKKILLDQDIPCECCNNFFPAYIRLTGENVNWKQIEDYIKRSMGKAADLGAKILVFGSSGAKNVPPGFNRDRAFEQIARVLDLADKYAVDYDIKVVIEPLNRQESNIILNVSDGLRLAQAGNYKNVRLLVDYYHFVMEGEEITVLQKAADIISHVHFADPKKRRFPEKENKTYEKFFEKLRQIGYKERISIEAYSENPEKDIKSGRFICKYF